MILKRISFCWISIWKVGVTMNLAGVSKGSARATVRRVFGAVAAAAVLALGVGATGGASHVLLPQAVAHDAVIASTPGEGEVLAEFPREIRLEFSGLPQDSFNTVAITREGDSSPLWTGTPNLEGNVVSVTLPDDVSPGSGKYLVGYQIVSSDGHSTRGKLNFEVAGSAPAETAEGSVAADTSSANTATSTAATAADSSDGKVASSSEAPNALVRWAPALGLAGVVVLVLLFVIRGARRK